MNNYGAVLSVADDILTLPAEVEALPLCSSAFCGAAGSCQPLGRPGTFPPHACGESPRAGAAEQAHTTPYPPPPHSPVSTVFRGAVSENTNPWVWDSGSAVGGE